MAAGGVHKQPATVTQPQPGLPRVSPQRDLSTVHCPVAAVLCCASWNDTSTRLCFHFARWARCVSVSSKSHGGRFLVSCCVNTFPQCCSLDECLYLQMKNIWSPSATFRPRSSNTCSNRCLLLITKHFSVDFTPFLCLSQRNVSLFCYETSYNKLSSFSPGYKWKTFSTSCRGIV